MTGISEIHGIFQPGALASGSGYGDCYGLASMAERVRRRPGIRCHLTAVCTALINIFLDERTRELCGDGSRWPDLAMRGKLLSRVQAFKPDAGPNIKDFHVLRPIPQTQLNDVALPNTQQFQNCGSVEGGSKLVDGLLRIGGKEEDYIIGLSEAVG